MSVLTKKDEITADVKKLIIERLNLSIEPDSIVTDAPLFLGSEEAVGKKGLGLDSVDALELVVGLNNKFDVVITDENMEIFENVDKIVAFVLDNHQN
ncbi:MAG: acyl carrier protein [Spirochaetaceae bacterium]|nr:acyl carrier protein [Spirochaetaceae bacterium]